MAMASGKKKVPKQESSSRGKAKILDAGKKVHCMYVIIYFCSDNYGN